MKMLDWLADDVIDLIRCTPHLMKKMAQASHRHVPPLPPNILLASGQRAPSVPRSRWCGIYRPTPALIWEGDPDREPGNDDDRRRRDRRVVIAQDLPGDDQAPVGGNSGRPPPPSSPSPPTWYTAENTPPRSRRPRRLLYSVCSGRKPQLRRGAERPARSTP